MFVLILINNFSKHTHFFSHINEKNHEQQGKISFALTFVITSIILN